MGRLIRWKDRWYARYTDAAGGRHTKRAHGVRADGERFLRDIELKTEREKLGLEELPGAPVVDQTLETLTRDWKAHLLTERRPRTWESYYLGLKDLLGWLTAKLGKPPERVRDVKLADVQAYAQERRDGRLSARSANMRVGALRTLFNWAVREGRIVANPLQRWRPLQGPKVRERRALNEAEIPQLLDASPDHLADVWRFVLGTGLRAGELAALEWRDVDFDQGTIRIRSEVAKSSRERFIPLRADLAVMLSRLRSQVPQRRRDVTDRLRKAQERVATAADADRLAFAHRKLAEAQRNVWAASRFVFLNSVGGSWGQELSRRLVTCLRKAGIDKAHLDVHALRHSFGSHLIANGVDVKTVADLMGHSDPGLTLRVYAHSFSSKRRQAVEAMPLPQAPPPERTARHRRAARA